MLIKLTLIITIYIDIWNLNCTYQPIILLSSKYYKRKEKEWKEKRFSSEILWGIWWGWNYVPRVIIERLRFLRCRLISAMKVQVPLMWRQIKDPTYQLAYWRVPLYIIHFTPYDITAVGSPNTCPNLGFHQLGIDYY